MFAPFSAGQHIQMNLNKGYVSQQPSTNIGHVQTQQKVGNFDVSYKPNEALRKFDGNSAHYKMWADRMLDHLARTNSHWRVILKALQAAPNPINKDWLLGQWVQGVNAWELAEKLETFICTWVNDALYSTRVQLAGGPLEAGNGFEMWRTLFHEHHGGVEAVQLGGMRRLQEWPKCTTIGNLDKHLAS